MRTILAAFVWAALLPAAPNVVIILVDDLGYADVGAFGSTRNHTPNIDRLASEGMRLTSMYATHLCTPTRAALMTGSYPWRVGLPKVLFPDDTIGLSQSETTIAEHMRALGYRTGLIGKWHLGHLLRHLPLQHGFDEWFGLPYSNDMIPSQEPAAGHSAYPPLPLYRDNVVIDYVEDNQQSTLTGRYTTEAIRFMKDNRRQPFFLLLAHTWVHKPLPKNDYSAAVEEIDSSTGELLEAIDKFGLRDDTIVFFLSDNGGTGGWGSSNAPFSGHKGQAWTEGAIRVPMIARWPSVIPAGSEQIAIASVMDFLPTLVAAAGGTVPEIPKIDGKNIWPLLRNDQLSGSRTFFSFGARRMRSVRSGAYKFDVISGALFNLFHDPAEEHDVAWKWPEVVTSMRRFVAEMANDLGTTLANCGPGCRSPGY